MVKNWKRAALAAFAVISLGSTLLLTGCPKAEEETKAPEGGPMKPKKEGGASSAPK